jgi:putative iron-regulated protein
MQRDPFRVALAAGAMLLASVLHASAAGAQQCSGDCDDSGDVSVGELVMGVNLALRGEAPVSCPNLDNDSDGAVGVDDLVGAVTRSLAGCEPFEVDAAAVVANYAEILFQNYSDAVRLAEELKTAVNAFVAAPSAATLQAAKQAWLDGRPTYLQTEMARFYDGPIDNEENGPEGLVNAWPLDESFIDYVEGDPQAGIVNRPDLFPEISKDLLVDLNERDGETTISTGWHAIEFLLWGQDHSASRPGARPFSDYVAGAGGTATNQDRRGAYLSAAAELLVENLAQVRDAWAPSTPGNYRADLLAADTDEALRRILTGLGTLSGGELTGERLSVAFDTKDQEDEHSCFSDNTHVDHRNDEIGIQNAFNGRYGAVVGPGIYHLVRQVDPTLADETVVAMRAARNAIFAIPVPFDQAILGNDETPGRQAIAAAIAALNAQTDKIADCAEALGISISTT